MIVPHYAALKGAFGVILGVTERDDRLKLECGREPKQGQFL